jgi:hypothetical protein
MGIGLTGLLCPGSGFSDHVACDKLTTPAFGWASMRLMVLVLRVVMVSFGRVRAVT